MQVFLTNHSTPFVLLHCILFSQQASITIAFILRLALLRLAFIVQWLDLLDTLALLNIDWLISETASTV